jgi:alkyl hydroperoxide reductase subunit F
VALLNISGKGKMPDEGLKARIRSLDPSLDIRTYVSLSCENCPDIVQAFNQIVLIHGGGLRHTMIDGAHVPEELQALGIQGVPSVWVGDEMIHSGRGTFAELLVKLEARGSEGAQGTRHTELGHFGVAVLGGGPAGASAAIYSVRKGIKTLLVAEKLGGQVQETKGIENLISVVYTEGRELASNLYNHLKAYPLEILEHRRVAKVLDGEVKTVHLESGESFTCDSLIVATGAKWRELGIPGERDYIGRGVAFCPHCDGPYYKGKKVAVIGGGNSGVEAAIDLAGLCREVVLFEYLDTLKADDVLVKKLYGLPNVSVVLNAKTSEILGNGEKVVGMNYEDRVSKKDGRIDLDGIFVQIGLSPNSAVVKDLVEVNRFGEIVVDSKGRTNITGIYAAGDVTTVPYKQIVIAMGEGAKVALTAFEDKMRS